MANQNIIVANIKEEKSISEHHSTSKASSEIATYLNESEIIDLGEVREYRKVLAQSLMPQPQKGQEL